jgi:uncharacterized membrane protein YedE/YeeE
MKFAKYLFIGIFFGILMSKSEAISWYRIQEMFRFQAFQMYGIIGSALLFGIAIVAFIKKTALQNLEKQNITFKSKGTTYKRYLFGGIVFGLGWALAGSCPGPIYILIGNGFSVFIIVLLSALLGTFSYGILRDFLPH